MWVGTKLVLGNLLGQACVAAAAAASIAARDPVVEQLGSYEADRVGALGDSRYCKYRTDFTPLEMAITYGDKPLDSNNAFMALMYAMEWIGFQQDGNNLTVQPPPYYGIQLTYQQTENQVFYDLEKHVAGNMLFWMGWNMTETNQFREMNGTVTQFGKTYATFSIKNTLQASGSTVQTYKSRRATLLGDPSPFDNSVDTRIGKGWHSLNATETSVVKNLITWCGCEAMYTWFWDKGGSNEFASQDHAFNLGVALEATDRKTKFRASYALIGLSEMMKWQIAQPAFTKVDGEIWVNGTEYIDISVGW